MYKVASIGTYDNNYKLYEVTNNTHHGKVKYIKKTTYIVANSDADKFEQFYQKQNKLFYDMKKYDTPEFQKKASLKLKAGSALGGIVGMGIPLSVFAFTKNKYARFASVIAAIVGGIAGILYGVAFTTINGIIPNEFKKQYSKNKSEFQKLNITKVKEEKQKIGEIDYNK